MMHAGDIKGGPDQPRVGHDSGALRDEIVALAHHITAIAAAVDRLIADELQTIDQEVAGGTVVIDDVTPAYLRASEALQGSLQHLGAALEALSGASGSGTV